jgi:hypothetical protein
MEHSSPDLTLRLHARIPIFDHFKPPRLPAACSMNYPSSCLYSVRRIPPYAPFSKHVRWLPVSQSSVLSSSREGRPTLTSAVTSRERVPTSPTCKLPRLTSETDPVRDALRASYDAEIPRTPSADYDCALAIPLRLLLHANSDYFSLTSTFSKHALRDRPFGSVGNTPTCILEEIAP